MDAGRKGMDNVKRLVNIGLLGFAGPMRFGDHIRCGFDRSGRHHAGAAASAGNLLLCLHRAQNAADLASVAAANALYSGSSDPCSVAERTISGNNATIGSCTIEGEDVLVEAQVGTQMPFVSHVGKQSRAGPIVCE